MFPETESTKKKTETESSSTETDHKMSRQKSQQDSLSRNRKKMAHKSSFIDKQSESPIKDKSQRTILSKPLEAVKNNVVDSKSDSSSSTHNKVNLKNGETKHGADIVDDVLNMGDTVSSQQITCSPGVDLTSNTNVTFVSNTSIPELR